MPSLPELRDRERAAKSAWLDCLMRVDEMLSMHADVPDSGCVGALREAQNDALEAGRRCRALQERIAALEGPYGVLCRRPGTGWPQHTGRQ